MNENSCSIKLVHRNFFPSTTTNDKETHFLFIRQNMKNGKSFANTEILRPQGKPPVEIEAKSNQFESSLFCVILNSLAFFFTADDYFYFFKNS